VSDEGDYFTDVDRSVGADLEQWPAPRDRFSDFVIPELVHGSLAVEVSSVTRSGTRRISVHRNRLVASTEDLDHPARQSPEFLDGNGSVEIALDDGANRRVGGYRKHRRDRTSPDLP
jgi:hypothetical protein